MQLYYNILWIDNDLPEYIERGSIDRLSDFLKDLGFQPYIVPLLDEADLDDQLNQTKFDLIISDYQLDHTTGDRVVEHIRERKFLTEILFYSAKVNFKDELGDRFRFVDRVSFHLGRDTLLDRIEDLIELTLDKLLGLNATRGFITSETSQLDIVIEDLVMELVNNKLKFTQPDKDAVIHNYIDNSLAKRAEQFKTRYEEIGFDNIFHSVEAYSKWQIFRALLKQLNAALKSEEVKKFLSANATYFEQVIDVRNKFAHAKALDQKGKTVLKGQYNKEDFEYDTEKCITIRKNLISHKENFERLIIILERL